MLLVLALLSISVTVVLAETLAISKVAASGGACSTGAVYSLGGAGNLYQLDTTSGVRTQLATLPSNSSYNALGISSDGSRAFAVAAINGSTSQVFEFDTGDNAAVAGPKISGGYSFVMGALDPVTGIFYAGGYSGADVVLFAFDTTTSPPTALAGPIAEIAGFAGGSGGDMVFDSTGHLYVVSGGGVNQLVRVNQPIPTSGTDVALTATQLTSLSISGPNGITFDGDGYLYVSSSSTLTKVNPNTGAAVSSTAIGSASPNDSTVDLADCQYNGQLQVQADVAGRYAGDGAGDQFGLSITGGGIASGNAATTTGTGTGPQADGASTAGPVAALAGTTYEIHETLVGGTAANYTITASCVDAGDGNAPVPLTALTPGATTDYSLTFPTAGGSTAPAVSCTFTDTPRTAPVITFSKVLAATRIADTDQFSVAVRTGSAAGPVVSAGAAATTAGSGSSVTPGTGTTGAFVADAGTTYYLTEAAAGTTDLADYQARISCVDSAQLQSGLPVDVAFSGALAITPVNGAVIGCVLSNGVQRYSLASLAGPSAANPGATVTYTVTVSNTGSVAYTGDSTSFTDDLSGVLDDAAIVSGSATASTGSVNVVGATLSWAGPLAVAPAPGSTVTVTFQVKIDEPDAGDHAVRAVVAATGPGGACASSCITSVGVRSYNADVSVSSGQVTAGGTLDYTVTVANTGQAAYAGGSASFTDDLTRVGDDASYVPMSASASAGTLQVSATSVTWVGGLPVAPAPGSTVVIHFRLRVHAPDLGDRTLASTMTVPGAGGSCTACTTDVLVQQFSVTASADATSVAAGQPITYTLTVSNTGEVAYPDTPAAAAAGFSDDLSDITDDATVIPGSVSASSGTAGLVGDTLVWTGALASAPAPGSTVTVTFSVLLNSPDTGNRLLRSQVSPTGPGAVAAAAGPPAPPLGVRAFSIAAKVSADGTKPGSVVHFTFVVTNTGTAAYPAGAPAAFSVHLGGGLATARYNGDGPPGLSFANRVMSWHGPLAVGASTTVTYSLTLGAANGDGRLLDTIVTAAGSGATCGAAAGAPGTDCSVAASMSAAGGLAFTGVDVFAQIGVGLAALAWGVLMLTVALRRRRI